MNGKNGGRLPPRLRREARTVEAMIRLYCRGQHGGSQSLCPECARLLDYARQRLHACPFGEGKTTCARCAVHCYRPEMREEIRAVMRYAGPRMMLRHPLLTLCHLWDGLRREPGQSPATGRTRPS